MALLLLQQPAVVETYLSQPSPDNNYGITVSFLVGRGGGASNIYRALVYYDLSALAGKVIVSAKLHARTMSTNCTVGATLNVHRALTQWYEGLKDGAAPDGGTDGSTWNHRNVNGAVAWGAAGGLSGTDFVAAPTDAIACLGVNLWHEWDVTADVALFAAGTATNYGWWIKGPEDVNSQTGFFLSGENTSYFRAPMLYVEYHDAGNESLVLSGDDGTDAYIYMFGSNNNYGISYSIAAGGLGGINEDTRRGLVRREISGLPAGATLVSAVLHLNSYDTYNATSRTIAVHRALTQWYEGLKDGAAPDGGTDGSTWNLRNANGAVAWAGGAGGGSGTDYAVAATDSVAVTDEGAWHAFDVLADVEEFVAGTADNWGWWLIGDETAINTWKAFASREYVPTPLVWQLAIEYELAQAFAGTLILSGKWSAVRIPAAGTTPVPISTGPLCEIIVEDTSGNRVGWFNNFLRLSYTKRVNQIGVLEFTLADAHSMTDVLALNYRVSVYRENAAVGLDKTNDFVGRLRWWEASRDDQTIWKYRCKTYHSLLANRCIAWYANTANRTLFDGVKAETIAKTLVEYNAAASATTGNGRLRAGAITGLTVQTDAAGGNTIDWECRPSDNLLAVIQNIAAVGGGDFDVVVTSTGYDFRWYTGQLGTDRTTLVFFSTELGNMGKPRVTFNRWEQATVAVVGGKGEGSARATAIRTASDYAASNDIETGVDAQNMQTAEGLQAAGDKALYDKRATQGFAFEVLQTPACYYNLHYNLGDKVTARFGGTEYTMRIEAVTVTLEETGAEKVDIEMVTL